jgi:gliding motility-associated-like protein
MNRHIFLLFISLFSVASGAKSQVANFILPDTVCVKQDISIQNTSAGGTSWYWNFCSGNLANTPIGLNLGNLGSLNGPVYSALAKDGNDFFVFITNVHDGTLSRLAFGNSLTNTPVAVNFGTLGVMMKNIEGIQIKKDSLTGNWFGLVAGGENEFLIRLNFGNSLSNTPTASNMGNINGLMSYTHTIYTFNEAGNWYTLMLNSDISTILRLDFGNSLSNPPTAVNLGNIGNLNGPVGFYPIQENGKWSVFVANKNSNSLSRLDFGSSLLNNPTGIDLGNIGSTMDAPRSITIIRDCGQVFGFFVNENPDDIVRLTFPTGLLGKPTAVSLGNIANFAFPHHISELFRVGDSLYAFVMNVNNNTISRLCFASCNNSTIASSNQQTPPVYSYNSAGNYNVSLTVNEGMPSQSNICSQIVVIGPSVPSISGDTSICSGEILNLESVSDSGSSYHWSGPKGYISSDHDLIIPKADTSFSGIYSLVLSQSGCFSDTAYQNVNVIMSPEINLGNDTTICQGQQLLLAAGSSAGLYTWSTGETTQQISVEFPGIYSVLVSDGQCIASDTILIEDCGSALWLPNAFSPNLDGKNDIFKPVSQGFLTTYQIQIFNRWGQQVYESSDPSTGWDGTFNGNVCPDDLYVYIVRYSLGTELPAGKQSIKHGTITIIR